jgi:putative SOS response-associated peptidase YedK
MMILSVSSGENSIPNSTGVSASSTGEVEQVLARWGLVPSSFPTLEPLAYAGIRECRKRDDQILGDPVSERRLEGFSILTITPNGLMVRIHDRQPVILSRDDWRTWLDPQASLSTLEGLLVPYPARGMDAFLVSPKVGSPKATGPELPEPLG